MNGKTQITLASFFQLTTVATILFAVAAPVVRGIWGESRVFITVGLVQGIVFLGLLWLRRRSRIRIAQTAGELLFRTPWNASRRLSDLKVVDWLCVVTVVFYTLFMAIPDVQRKLFADVGWLILFLHPISLLTQYVVFDTAARALVSWRCGLDQVGMEVYENGYVSRSFRYQPFQGVKEVRASRYSPGKIEVVFRAAPTQGGCSRWVKVPADYRDDIVAAMSKVIDSTSETALVSRLLCGG